MTIDRSMVARTKYEEFEQREREHGAGRRGEHAGEISVDAELVHGLEYQHAEQVHDDIAADVAHERTAITPSEHHRARGLVAEQDPAHDRHARCDRVASAQKDAKRVDAITKRSEEHTSELQSPCNLVCRLLLEKKKKEADSYVQ